MIYFKDKKLHSKAIIEYFLVAFEQKGFLLTFIYMAVGLYDTHRFEWPFLCTKVVKQFVFLVQSIVFIHMVLNL